MSSTLLETARGGHEEVERVERVIVKLLQNQPLTSKHRFVHNHRLRYFIDRLVNTSNTLVDIYEDKDNARKDEIAALGGQTASGTNVFSAFYDRLKEIRDYHRRHPAAQVIDPNEEFEELLKEEPRIEFTGEEAFGRYLDLHELYNDYINSKFGEPMEYLAYLDVFSQPHKVPRKHKLSRKQLQANVETNPYLEYLEKLLDYLVNFLERTEPLQDLDRMFPKVASEFEEQWANGNVQGWENDAHENGQISAQPDVIDLIDLENYNTVEELMEVGPERLKEALAALGLKIGGTIKQRAERLFFTKHTPIEMLDKKHFAKGFCDLKQNGVGASPHQTEASKEIALLETKIEKVCDLLHETIVRTKENVEKKQALTYEEMEAEREEEEDQAGTESDDDEQQIYNPLKLPMGWDGKPIPYWLYKLHGLGQEFKCEICGNHSYWGRRAYERHFKEFRHQHGMRCLGIPNTKNFNEITSIEEAKQLWGRIQEQQGVKKWRAELEEEFEDREGNIYNKKTYTDLQRQGLI